MIGETCWRRWLDRFCAWLVRRAERRRADFVIRPQGKPYLFRWWMLPRNPFLNIYVHRIVAPDDDRALHDHPWPWASYIVSGAYAEYTDAALNHTSEWDAATGKWRTVWFTGSLRGHLPWFAHRLEPLHGEVWTVFFIGPKLRAWGFLCPKGWLHWKRFTAAGDKGTIGRGCDGHGDKPTNL